MEYSQQVDFSSYLPEPKPLYHHRQLSSLFTILYLFINSACSSLIFIDAAICHIRDDVFPLYIKHEINMYIIFSYVLHSVFLYLWLIISTCDT